MSRMDSFPRMNIPQRDEDYVEKFSEGEDNKNEGIAAPEQKLD